MTHVHEHTWHYLDSSSLFKRSIFGLYLNGIEVLRLCYDQPRLYQLPPTLITRTTITYGDLGHTREIFALLTGKKLCTKTNAMYSTRLRACWALPCKKLWVCMEK